MTNYKLVQIDETTFAIKKRVFFIFWQYVTVPGYKNIVWTSKTLRGAKAYMTLLSKNVRNVKKTK